jgi:hypothetical protein
MPTSWLPRFASIPEKDVPKSSPPAARTSW